MWFPSSIEWSNREGEKPLLSEKAFMEAIRTTKDYFKRIFWNDIFSRNLDSKEVLEKILDTDFNQSMVDMMLQAYWNLFFFPTSWHKEFLLWQRSEILDIGRPIIDYFQTKQQLENIRNGIEQIQDINLTVEQRELILGYRIEISKIGELKTKPFFTSKLSKLFDEVSEKLKLVK